MPVFVCRHYHDVYIHLWYLKYSLVSLHCFPVNTPALEGALDSFANFITFLIASMICIIYITIITMRALA